MTAISSRIATGEQTYNEEMNDSRELITARLTQDTQERGRLISEFQHTS